MARTIRLYKRPYGIEASPMTVINGRALHTEHLVSSPIYFSVLAATTPVGRHYSFNLFRRVRIAQLLFSDVGLVAYRVPQDRLISLLVYNNLLLRKSMCEEFYCFNRLTSILPTYYFITATHFAGYLTSTEIGKTNTEGNGASHVRSYRLCTCIF